MNQLAHGLTTTCNLERSTTPLIVLRLHIPNMKSYRCKGYRCSDAVLAWRRMFVCMPADDDHSCYSPARRSKSRPARHGTIGTCQTKVAEPEARTPGTRRLLTTDRLLVCFNCALAVSQSRDYRDRRADNDQDLGHAVRNGWAGLMSPVGTPFTYLRALTVTPLIPFRITSTPASSPAHSLLSSLRNASTHLRPRARHWRLGLPGRVSVSPSTAADPSHTSRALTDAGFRVRATVRDNAKGDYLKSILPDIEIALVPDMSSVSSGPRPVMSDANSSLAHTPKRCAASTQSCTSPRPSTRQIPVRPRTSLARRSRACSRSWRPRRPSRASSA